MGVTFICLMALLSSVNFHESTAAPLNQEQITSLLRKRIKFNGESMELSDLYGYNAITPNNFHPGPSLLATLPTQRSITIYPFDRDIFFLTMKSSIAGSYIPRVFSTTATPKTSSTASLASTSSMETIDTPNQIAAMLSKANFLRTTQLIAITGTLRSGKTVAMLKIEDNLRSSRPSSWTIRIDLPKTLGSLTPQETLTLPNVLGKSLTRMEFDLFQNVLDVNPTSVNILFDNFDGLSRHQRDEMTSIVSNLYTRGASVVLSSSSDMSEQLRMISPGLITYEIPPMSTFEVRSYLEDAWTTKLQLRETQQNLRVSGYALAISQALEATPLPRTIGMIETLAVVLASSNTIWDNESVRSGMQFRNYVLDRSIASTQLLQQLENAKFNKIHLYDEFFKRPMQSNPLTMIKFYGVVALNNIIPVKTGPVVDELGFLVREYVDKVLLRFNTNAFELVYFEKSLPNPKFIHAEYERYFAAKYLQETLVSEQPPVEIWRLILENSDYRYLLEFVDSRNIEIMWRDPQMKVNLREIIKVPLDTQLRIMDNLIKHGFGHLAVYIAKQMKAINLKYYIYQPTKLEATAGSSMGMLPPPTSSSTPEPAANPPIVGTRRELLLLLDMYHTLKYVQTAVPQFGPKEDVEKLLEIAVTRRKRNNDVYNLIVKSAPKQVLKPSLLNKLLFMTINEVGCGSKQTAIDLYNRGATPGTIVVKNRSLLRAAVQWASEELLNFVISDLKVPISNLKKSEKSLILMDALDANPFPRHTQPGWWKMMWYLINNKMVKVPSSSTISQLTLPTIDNRETSLYYRLITGIYNNPQNGRKEPLKMNDARLQEAKILASLVPPRFSAISADLLALRRICTLQTIQNQNKITSPPRSGLKKIIVSTLQSSDNDKVGLLDVMVHYRGIDSLSSSENAFYRSTIETLFIQKQNSMTNVKKIQLLAHLYNNIANFDDLNYLLSMMNEHVFSTVDISFNDDIFSIIKDRVLIGHDSSSQPTVSLNDETSFILQTRADLHPEPLRETMSKAELRIFHGTLKIIFSHFSNKPISYNDYRSLEDSYSCFSSRYRRSVLASSCIQLRNDLRRIQSNSASLLEAIQINSQEFLRLLASPGLQADPARANRLVDFVKMLQNAANGVDIFTGHYKILSHNAIAYGGLNSYRNRQTHMITYKQGFTTGLQLSPYKKTMLGIGAQGLLFVKSLHETIMACVNDKNSCTEKSTTLLVSTFLFSATYLAARYTTFIIDRLSRVALEMAGSMAPRIWKDSLLLIRSLGLKFGTQFLVGALTFIGIGFSIVSIIDMVSVIGNCSKNNDNCLSKDRNAAIIKLSFSCVSIPVTGALVVSRVGFLTGSLIGLALVLAEMVALAINDVVYYQKKYKTTVDEGFRLFWHSFVFLKPPQDVQDLVTSTDTIQLLGNQTYELLSKTSDNIVAIGVGLGRQEGLKTNPSNGTIRMDIRSNQLLRTLSRIGSTMHFSGTYKLCMPQRTHASFDANTYHSPNAVHYCENAFVLANSSRWRRRSKNSYVLFDLSNINTGEIAGSPELNNLFVIHAGDSNLRIKGGHGNFTNIYVINDDFYGLIELSSASQQEIFDLSSITNEFFVKFSWNDSTTAYLSYENKVPTAKLITGAVKSLNLHVIGRQNLPDDIICREIIDSNSNSHTMTADGNGGLSEDKMDSLTGCNFTVLRPYTNLISAESLARQTYVTQMSIEPRLAGESRGKPVTSRILTKQSQYAVLFTDHSLLSSVYSLKYSPRDKSLTWQLQYDQLTTMNLVVEPYFQPFIASESTQEAITTIFVDKTINGNVFPIINQPQDGVSEVTVDEFNVVAAVELTNITDVLAYYRHVSIFWNENLHITTKLYNSANESFFFGSSVNDRFYIESGTKYLSGCDGSDVYVWSTDSPAWVLIDNQAADEALDILLIMDDICDTLRVIRLENHVRLVCSTGNDGNRTVQLQDYMSESKYRHLLFLWRESVYMILPGDWQRVRRHDEGNLDYALVVSIDEMRINGAMTLEDRDTYVVLNITGKSGTLVAARDGRDVILTERNADLYRVFFVTLKHFFLDDATGRIAEGWLDNIIYVVSGEVSERTTPIVLTSRGVVELLRDSDGEDEVLESEVTEFHVDLTDRMKQQRIVIDESMKSGKLRDEDSRVIRVTGASPREFSAHWESTDKEKLALCAYNTCLIMKDWCVSRDSRINRVEFYLSSTSPPIVLNNLNKLECQEDWSSSNSTDLLITHLNKKLQRLDFLVNNGISDNSDNSQLLQCVSLLYADNVTRSFTYRIFGFESILDQVHFMQTTCEKLLIWQNLQRVSQKQVQFMWTRVVNQHFMTHDDLTSNDAKLLKIVEESFKNLTLENWKLFISDIENSSRLDRENQFNI